MLTLEDVERAIEPLRARIRILETLEQDPYSVTPFPVSSNLTLTTSYQDVPGTSLIIPNRGISLVQGIFDVNTGNDDLDNGQQFNGALLLNNIQQPLVAVAPLQRISSANRLRQTVMQAWRIAIWDYRQTVLQDNPLSYWPLSETSGLVAHDFGMTGTHGTIVGGVTLNQEGPLKADSATAALFNGTTGEVTFGVVPGLSGSVSMEAWVHSSAWSASHEILVVLHSAGTYISINNGNAFASFVISGVQRTFDSGYALTTNTWHHVVATYDGSNIRIYVDGVLRGTSGAFAGTNNAAVAGILGAFYGGVLRLSGTLTQAAAYATALNATRILAHYDAALNARETTAATLKLQAKKTGGTGTSQLLLANSQMIITRIGALG